MSVSRFGQRVRKPGPNAATRKKYPHAVKETIVWIEPKEKKQTMSLFEETAARAARAEKALDIAQIETSALKSQVKLLTDQLATERRARTEQLNSTPRIYPSMAARAVSLGPPRFEMNALSESDVEEMFKAKDYYDQQDEKVSADRKEAKIAINSAAPIRSRLLAPIAALFRR